GSPRSVPWHRGRRRRYRGSRRKPRPAWAAFPHLRPPRDRRETPISPFCRRLEARPTRPLSGATSSRGSLIGEKSLAEDTLESGEREARAVTRLHEIGLCLRQIHFGIEEVENRSRAAGVARLLYAKTFFGDGEPLLRERSRSPGCHVSIVRRRHVVLHAAIHVFPERAGHIAIHPRPREPQLPLAVVPDRQRN